MRPGEAWMGEELNIRGNKKRNKEINIKESI